MNRFLKESLPAMPILNRARLQSACFNPQAPTPFPYTVLTGILTHAAAHFANLRPRIRELWKIVLSLEENEYRQPRLQTLQLTLLDIWGRPCSSPGHNHAALCRVSDVQRQPERDVKADVDRLSERLNYWDYTGTAIGGSCQSGNAQCVKGYGGPYMSLTSGQSCHVCRCYISAWSC